MPRFQLIVRGDAQCLGACQSAGGSVERGDFGRKNRQPMRFVTTGVECHGASAQRVRDVSAANIREAGLPLILGTHVRSGAEKARPSRRECPGLSSGQNAIQRIRICAV
jgi:hypothetical protein